MVIRSGWMLLTVLTEETEVLQYVDEVHRVRHQDVEGHIHECVVIITAGQWLV